MSGFLRSYDQGASWTPTSPSTGPTSATPSARQSTATPTTSSTIPMRRPPRSVRQYRRRAILAEAEHPVAAGRCLVRAVTLMEDGGCWPGPTTRTTSTTSTIASARTRGRTWTEEEGAGSTRRFGIRNWATSGAGTISMGGPEATVRARTASFCTNLRRRELGQRHRRQQQYRPGDGYSANCLIHTDDDGSPDELMVLFSIQYKKVDTNEYVFFIRPGNKGN